MPHSEATAAKLLQLRDHTTVIGLLFLNLLTEQAAAIDQLAQENDELRADLKRLKKALKTKNPPARR